MADEIKIPLGSNGPGNTRVGDFKFENPPLTQQDLTKLKDTTLAGMKKLNDNFEALKLDIKQSSTNNDDIDILLNRFHSSQINELSTALSAAQGEIKPLSKNAKGNWGDFANLANVLNYILPILSKNKLSIVQDQIMDIKTKDLYLLTILTHNTSGQWIKSLWPIYTDSGKETNADYAKSITYWKRYTLQSLLGITAANEDDLDSFEEEAVEPEIKKPESKPTPSKPNQFEQFKKPNNYPGV
jgi:hypothetical protein